MSRLYAEGKNSLVNCLFNFCSCGLKIGTCQVQGESHITSHLHHIATSDIAYHGTSNQAQARPEGRDKGVHHFLKQKKHFLSLALTLTCTLTIRPQATSNVVSSPDPHQHSKRRRGLVNIVQHFCTSMEFQWYISDWLIWQLSHGTGLPYHKPLSFTHHTFTDLLNTPPIC